MLDHLVRKCGRQLQLLVAFQQDGAPADFGAIVFTVLNDFLVDGSAVEGRLIGPHGFLT
jgi:hypothetical protein